MSQDQDTPSVVGFTPGPWFFSEGHDELATYVSVFGPVKLSGAADVLVCELAHNDTAPHTCSLAEARANAHLIAAAPDLLEALKGISNMLMGRPDIVRALEPLMGFAEHAQMNRAAVAIAKAEGRS